MCIVREIVGGSFNHEMVVHDAFPFDFCIFVLLIVV